MKIATWNLERGRSGAAHERQQARLASLDVDILVITEPPAEMSISGAAVVTSPAKRSGSGGPEAWIAVTGVGVELVEPQLPFGRLAVAARTTALSEPVVVYGSVLPWLAAPAQASELAEAGETYAAMFERMLTAQVDDVCRLREEHPRELVVWAGDFNQTLSGPNHGGSKASRELVQNALDQLGYVAWNAEEPHAEPGMCAIDLICGPKDRRVRSVERIDPQVDGHAVSDHAGYIVELA